MELILELITKITDFSTLIGPVYTMLLGVLMVVAESIAPILPLAMIITLNMLTLGIVQGFIVSYIGCIIGSMIAFTFFDKYAKKSIHKKFKHNPKVMKLIKYIDTKPFPFLVMLLAIPFLPAFLINITAGIADIKPKTYFLALLVGKISIVYFWGFIGASLVKSLTSPAILIELFIIMAVTYIISYIISKKFVLKEI